jgi:hypothetical protein
MMWYVGSRTSKKCHPNDGYICSSKTVKPLIMSNPLEWVREIVDIGLPDDMYNLETDILRLFDARNDPKSFNKHNNSKNRYDRTGHKETQITRDKKSKSKTGKKRPEHSEALRGRQGYWKDKTRPDICGKNNPASKCYIITPPNEDSYEVYGIKGYAKSQGWPSTFWDIVNGKYIPKCGKLKGYQIRLKDGTT